MWNDTNGNGIQDGGEPGLAGVLVRMYDENSEFYASTVTDSNGGYAFTGVGAGYYQLQFQLLTGYQFSPANAGSDDAVDSDADPLSGFSNFFFVTYGAGNTTIDAGMRPTNPPVVPPTTPPVVPPTSPPPPGSDVRANTYTSNYQTVPAVASDADGDFVIAWMSDGQDGSGYGVYAQRYAANGTPVGNEFRVNTTTLGDQGSPSVAMDADGDFIVTWQSYGQEGTYGNYYGHNLGIYAQRYSASGAAVGSEFRVNTFTYGLQFQPSVAMDADGDFVIAWASGGQGPGSNWYDVYAQRYSASGAALGSEFRVNTYITSSQMDPAVTMDADGDFVIAWESQGQDGSVGGIYAQRYTAGGAALGSEFRVNTYTTNQQMGPAVAADANGGFVVVWLSSGQEGSASRVYAQRYAANGTALGSEFRVNTYTGGHQSSPSVAVDADGDFVVTWQSYGQDGSRYGVWAQRYNSTGTAVGSEFRVNTYTAGDQMFPTVAVDADGDAVVAWQSAAQDGSGNGIYFALLGGGSSPPPVVPPTNPPPAGPEVRANTHTTGHQVGASVATDADGNFVVAWTSQDQDGSGTGIYAQRYAANGMPLGGEFRVNTYTTGHQAGASVAMDADGDFVVAWASAGQDGSGYGIYAQRYAASGVPLGGEYRVNTFTTGNQTEPSVGVDADGDFVVAWQTYVPGSGLGGYEIQARRYSASGAALGSEFRVNTYTTNDQAIPSVSVAAGGNFVIAWQSYGQDGSGTEVYARRYSAGGDPLGTEFRVNTYTDGHQVAPSVGLDASGNFVVAWQSSGQGDWGWRIYARRYSAGGTALGSEFRVGEYTTGYQADPSVAVDADGDFIISWTSAGEDGSGNGIYAQRYSSAGTTQGTALRVNTYTAGDQMFPAVAVNADGDAVVAWQSDGQDGSGNGIYFTLLGGGSSSPPVVPPTVTISATGAGAGEPSSTGMYRISRTGTSGDLAVTFVPSGTAARGADYTLSVGGVPVAGNQVTIYSGQSFVDVLLTPVDDAVSEPTETAVLTLQGSSVYSLGAAYAATINITDDDPSLPPPTVTISATGAGAGEPSSTGMYRISRTGTSGDLAVTFVPSGTAASGADYTLSVGGVPVAGNQVTIYSGQSFVDVLLTPVDDAVSEPTETVVLTLQGSSAYTVGSPAAATVSITDNDLPAVTAAALDATAGEPSSTGMYRISRTGPQAGALEVRFALSGAATPGADYTLSVGGVPVAGDTVTIQDGLGFVDVLLTPVDDATAEFTEDAVLTVLSGTTYTVGSPAAATVSITDNEPPAVTVTAFDATAGEPSDTGTYRISRTGALAGALPVTFVLSGTAASGADYTLSVGGVPVTGNTVTIQDGQEFVDVLLTPIDDGVAEFTETAVLTLQSSSAYTVGSPAAATVSITDNDLPAVTAAALDATAGEPSSTGMYRISRTGPQAGALEVRFALSGAATPGADYTLSVGGVPVAGDTVTIQDGQGYVDVLLTPVDDATAEFTEDAVLTVLSGTTYTAGSPAAATVSITDNEPPAVTVTAFDATAGEPSDTGTYRISRTGALSGALPVTFVLSGTAASGADYTLSVGGVPVTGDTVTIEDGQEFVDVLLTPIDDGVAEFTEGAVLTLQGSSAYALGSPAAATVLIASSDVFPTVTVFATDVSAGEPANTGAYRIWRTGTSGALPVTFVLSGTATPGADYTLSVNGVPVTGNQITIQNGQEFVDVLLTPVDDAVSEIAETAVLTVLSSTTYTVGSPAAAVVGIDDNDTRPTVTVFAIDSGAGEPSNAGAYRITQFGAGGPLTVTFVLSGTAARGADYSLVVDGVPVAGNQITIPAGQSSVDVVLIPADDGIVETPETAMLALQAGATYTIGALAAATVTITDDDTLANTTPSVTVTATDADAGESANSGTYRIFRTGPIGVELVVAVALSGTATRGADYTLSVGGVPVAGNQITIPADASFVDVLLTPVDDAASEVPEAATLTVQAGGGYAVGAPADATVVIADNDPAVTPPAGFKEGELIGAADPFGALLATFTHPDLFSDPSDFEAAVSWGDGTTNNTTSGVEIVPLGGGLFEVRAKHAYRERSAAGNPYQVVITVTTRADGSTASASGSLAIADAALTGRSHNFTAGLKVPYEGAIAVFEDANTLSPAANFEAQVQWGDGTQEKLTGASIRPLGAGVFAVVGKHAYQVAGAQPYTVTVLIQDVDGSAQAVTSTATVGAVALVASDYGVNVTATEGTAFSGEVAWFTTLDTNFDPATVLADVNWGDGTAIDFGRPVVARDGGGFTVAGTHLYARSGGYEIQVTIRPAAGGNNGARTIKGSALVLGGQITATGLPITVREGTGLGSGQVIATFTDAVAGTTATDYSAWVDLGNGDVASAPISKNGNHFEVRLARGYEQNGSYTATVTIRDNLGGSTAIVQSDVTVINAELAIEYVNLIGSGYGDLSFSMRVGFKENPYDRGENFTATVNWGDGTPASMHRVYGYGDHYNGNAFFSSYNPAGDGIDEIYYWLTPGQFEALPRHTYAAAGTYIITITITPDDGPAKVYTPWTWGLPVILPQSQPISNTAPIVTALPITAVEGQRWDGKIAQFVDPFPEMTGTFSVSVDWGNGHYAANVPWYQFYQITNTGYGTYDISTSYRYNYDGIYQVKVRVYKTYSNTNQIDTSAESTTTAIVSEAPFRATSLSVTGASMAGTVGQSFSGVVATGTLRDPAYGTVTAYINWGDGSAEQQVAVIAGATYSVSGTHTYASEGLYNVRVRVEQRPPNVQTQLVHSASTTNTIKVTVPAVSIAAAQDPLAATQSTPPVNVALAVITDPRPGVTASEYTADIYWGDGTKTLGTVAGTGGTFTVSGSHTYGASGPFIAAVVARRGAEVYAVRLGVTVAPPPPPLPAPTNDLVDLFVDPVIAQGAYQAQDLVVARFRIRGQGQSVAGFAAEIHWGDGSAPTRGRIEALPSEDGELLLYQIVGSHQYRATGVYDTTVTLISRSASCPDTVGTGVVVVLSGAVKGFDLQTSVSSDLRDVVVGEFTDPSDPPASTFSASVNWAGYPPSSSPARVVRFGAGHYYVVASRGYASAGQYQYQVNVSSPGGLATGYGTVDVRPTAAGVLSVPYRMEVPTTPLQWAAFTVNSENIPNEIIDRSYIDWGDGSLRLTGDRGQVWGGLPQRSDILLSGAHVFRQDGVLTVTGGAADDVGDPYVTDSWSLPVATAPHRLVGTRPVLAAREDRAIGSIPIATFTDEGTEATVDQFHARIDWGDGTEPSDDGTRIVRIDDRTFAVYADHTYNQVGDFAITVLVHKDAPDGVDDDMLAGTMVATLKARVTADQAGVSQTGAEWFAALQGQSTGDIVLGAIVDPALAANAAALSVNWGDGSAPQAGEVWLRQTGPTSFEVLGRHTYAQAGIYDAKLTVTAGPKVFTLGGLVPVYRAALDTTQRTSDPDRGDWVQLGTAAVSLNTGAVTVSHPLDFDLSPGTAVGRSPSLVYNSGTVDVRPTAEFQLTGLGEASPSGISVTTSWADRKEQPAVTFAVTPGAQFANYLFGTQSAYEVTETGAYDWRSHVQIAMGANRAPIEVEVKDRSLTVVTEDHPEVPVPVAHGWGIAGIDRLVWECHGDVIWVTGTGDARLFERLDGTDYWSDEDFGALQRNMDANSPEYKSFVYTARDASKMYFSAAGLLTKVVDPQQFVVTYGYDAAGRLTGVQTPDGGVTAIAYTPTQVTITEPGNRTVTLNVAGKTLNAIQDVDSTKHLSAYADVDKTAGTRTFGYSGDRLTSDTWSPLQTGIAYDKNGMVKSVDRGLGTVYTIVPAAAQSLATTNDKPADARTAVATLKDPINPVTTYTYDARGRTLRVDAPLGALDRYLLNTAGDVVWHADPLDRKTVFEYDFNGDLRTVVNPDETERSYQYHPKFGTVTRATDELSRATVFTYDGTTGLLSTVEDALHNVTKYEYYPDADGGGTRADRRLLKTVTDALGHVTSYAYDEHRRVSQVIDPAGGIVTTTYDAAGNPLKVLTNPSLTGNTSEVRTTTTVYDGRNQLVRVIDARGSVTSTELAPSGLVDAVTDALGRRTTYAYDRRGLLTGMTEGIAPAAGLPAGVPPAQRSEARVYDTAGNLKSVTSGLAPANPTVTIGGAAAPLSYQHLTTVTYEYDALNRVKGVYEGVTGAGAYLRGTETAYDRAGNVRWTRSGLSTTGQPKVLYSRLGYDLQDQLGQVIEAFGHARLQRTTTTEYDDVGNVLSVTDPLGHVTSYGYDELNRTTVTYEAFGTSDQRSTETHYDAVGNVLWTRDPRGTVTSYGYDPADRVTRVIEAFGDTGPGGVQRTTTMLYDKVGNVLATWAPRYHDNQAPPAGEPKHVVTSYVYDGLDRRTQVIEAVNVAPEQLGHANPITTTTYDAVGNVVSVIDPLGRTTSYAYDALDRPVAAFEVWQSNGTAARTTRTWYDASDNVVRRHAAITANVGGAESTTNQQLSTYAYDAVNRPISSTVGEPERAVPPGGAPLLRLTTTSVYDAADNLIESVDPDGRRTSMGYDVLGRQVELVEAFGDAGPGGVQRTTTMLYDAADNLLTVWTPRYHDSDLLAPGEPRHVATSFGYDALNRRTQVIEAFGVSALQRTTTTVYDAGDLVRAVQEPLPRTTTYEYDALGRRTQVVEPVDELGVVVWTRTTETTYDAADNVRTVVTPRVVDTSLFNEPALRPETRYEYDLLNRLTRVTEAANVPDAQLGHAPPATTYRYDAAGRKILEIAPATWSTELLRNTSQATSYTYDTLDRAVTVEEGRWDPQAATPFAAIRRTTMKYDGQDNLVGQTRGIMATGVATMVEATTTTAFVFDAAGRQVAVTEAVGRPEQRTTTREYDGAGHVVLERLTPNEYRLEGVPANEQELEKFRQRPTTKYTYDGLGRLKTTIQAYVAPGEFSGVTDPGGLGHQSQLPVTTYQYDAADRVIRTTDPRGVQSTYVYDALGRLRDETQGASQGDATTQGFVALQREYGYDAADRKTAVGVRNLNLANTDATTAWTTYAYDLLDRPTGVTEGATSAVARSTLTRYNDDGTVTVTTGVSATATLTGPTGNALVYNRPVETRYTYDALGRLARVDEGANLSAADVAALGHTRPWTTFAYDAAGHTVATFTNASTTPGADAVIVTRYLIDGLGRVWQTNEGEGGDGNQSEQRVTSVRYDTLDRVVGKVTLGDPSWTRYDYDALGRVTKQTTPALDPLAKVDPPTNPPTDPLYTAYVWNVFDQVVQQSDQNKSEGEVTNRYDRLGRLRTQVKKGTWEELTYQYDLAGNLLRVDDTVFPLWLENKKETGPSRDVRRTTTQYYAYDALGRRVSETDTYWDNKYPTGHTTHYYYDALGRVEAVWARDGKITWYGYDAVGRQVYEAWDQAVSPTKDNPGLEPFGAGALSRGERTVLATWYDAGDRITYALQGKATLQLQRDQAPNLLPNQKQPLFVRVVPDPIIPDTIVPYTVTQLDYDGLGRLRTETALGVTLTHWYDAAGRGTKVGDAGGYQTTAYDRANRVTARTLSGAAGAGASVQFTYAPESTTARGDRLLTVTAEQNGAATPKIREDIGYETTGLGREVSRGWSVSSKTAHNEYLVTTYDLKGRVWTETRAGIASTSEANWNPRSVRYTYDGFGQVLQQDTMPGADPSAEPTSKGTPTPHDASGNGPYPSKAAAQGKGYRVPSQVSASGGLEVTYDGLSSPELPTGTAGNVTRERFFITSSTGALVETGRWELEYDGRNRLVAVKVKKIDPKTGVTSEFRVNYVYDTFDRLVARYETANMNDTGIGATANLYLYADGQPYADVSINGSITARHLFGPAGQPLAGLAPGATEPHFYLTDRQNSVLQIVTIDGTTLKRIKYEGLNAERVGSGVIGLDRFELGGQTYDQTSGLAQLGGSWYDGRIGRQLTESGRGIGLNPYPVANNNAPNQLDKSEQAYPGAPAGWELIFMSGRTQALANKARGTQFEDAAGILHGIVKGLDVPRSMFESTGTRRLYHIEERWKQKPSASEQELWTDFGAWMLDGGPLPIQNPFFSFDSAVQDYRAARGRKLDRRVAVSQAVLKNMWLARNGWQIEEGIDGYETGGPNDRAKLSPGERAERITSGVFGLVMDVSVAGGFFRGRGPQGRAKPQITPAIAEPLVPVAPRGVVARNAPRLNQATAVAVHNVLPQVPVLGRLHKPVAWTLNKLGFEVCFASGTPMRTPGGWCNIENLRVGDFVLSRDEFSPEGDIEPKEIEEVFVREGLICVLTVLGQTIRSTDEHPFFVEGKGWTPLNQIHEGERIWTEASGWATVDAVKSTNQWETVYNFRVADHHTYFVGCDEWGFSVWAHNIGCTPEMVTEATRDVLSTASFRGRGRLRADVVEAMRANQFDRAAQLLDQLPNIGERRASRIVNRLVEMAEAAGDLRPPQLPLVPGVSKIVGPDGWTPPQIYRGRFGNNHDVMHNRIFSLDETGMEVHTAGHFKNPEGKSQFGFNVRARELLLDASAYAEHAGLWVESKAKVFFDQPIGIHARTGQPTNVLNIYRNKNNHIHGSPGSPQ
ncbi:SdrD B-like domain-containing protein [Gemmata obscuriglobus]|uniref:SdrD B-like domain-containing protein n=1 Tax=Gemmata obscuriglobus TaxID=114 RepID=UPI0013A5BB58|nr:SdrD B-like domain-containing protein [Gemmata obscuriglobus]